MRPGFGGDGSDGDNGQKITVAAGIPGVIFWLDDQLATAMVLRTPVDPLVVAQTWSNNMIDDRFDWNAYQVINPGAINGPASIYGVLHPESLDEVRISATIEYRVTGANPMVEIGFFGKPVYTMADAEDIGDGWFRLECFGIRRTPFAFGNGLDEFLYQNRDVEVRMFRFYPAGEIGDVNFDQSVDIDDLTVVVQNQGLGGGVQIRDGDANGDGVIDMFDVQEVVTDLTTAD